MNYITITSNSISKKYYAISYSPFISSPRSTKQLIGGGYDVVFGSNYKGANYTLRLSHTPEDSSFGSLQDLINLYSLVDTTSTTQPPFFGIIDHEGVSRTAFIPDSELNFQLLTTIVTGHYAYYIVQIKFLYI